MTRNRSIKHIKHTDSRKAERGWRIGAGQDETGATYKDWGGRLRVALTMPNTYFIGMSSLALQLLYRRFNAEEDVVCERIFWEKGAAQAGKQLLSLENAMPAADFDVWAFTVSWEMDYFNVVELLRQAALLLESENKRLAAKVVELPRRCSIWPPRYHHHSKLNTRWSTEKWIRAGVK